jgi:hypothetical protein
VDSVDRHVHCREIERHPNEAHTDLTETTADIEDARPYEGLFGNQPRDSVCHPSVANDFGRTRFVVPRLARFVSVTLLESLSDDSAFAGFLWVPSRQSLPRSKSRAYDSRGRRLTVE